MKTAVVLFTRDLRVHDNPALHAACTAAERVVPLFVVDPTISASPNRMRFLTESLADLRHSLRSRGGDLVIRLGDPVREAVALARSVNAFGIGLAADTSAYATRREARLRKECEQNRLALRLFDSSTVVPPGAVRPSTGGDHYKVFTPYWRVWQAHGHREELPAPTRLTPPDGIDPGELPDFPKEGSPQVVGGGETEGRRRLDRWKPTAVDYADYRDDLAGDQTSRLSPYLRFGCLSPVAVTVATKASEAFVRQLCWRDFYQQILLAFPALPHKAFRANAVEDWIEDPDSLDAWREGQTGIPLVDAGMRQLAAEGWMHNRAR
ncbi:MAG: deoxyribodipyrimidine photo-lyase, partial [Longispora sp.]|nr:deoxyribodipyrimidine photo-lyase [Longispora sp. (in: high G+C Gram-positive bacteria)]